MGATTYDPISGPTVITPVTVGLSLLSVDELVRTGWDSEFLERGLICKNCVGVCFADLVSFSLYIP